MSICRHFTSDFGPDLEPIMTPAGHQREVFEKAYKMGPLLGKGGFGTVYAGERTKDSLPVAIKVIKKAKITQWCQVRYHFYYYFFFGNIRAILELGKVAILSCNC